MKPIDPSLISRICAIANRIDRPSKKFLTFSQKSGTFKHSFPRWNGRSLPQNELNSVTTIYKPEQGTTIFKTEGIGYRNKTVMTSKGSTSFTLYPDGSCVRRIYNNASKLIKETAGKLPEWAIKRFIKGIK